MHENMKNKLFVLGYSILFIIFFVLGGYFTKIIFLEKSDSFYFTVLKNEFLINEKVDLSNHINTNGKIVNISEIKPKVGNQLISVIVEYENNFITRNEEIKIKDNIDPKLIINKIDVYEDDINSITTWIKVEDDDTASFDYKVAGNKIIVTARDKSNNITRKEINIKKKALTKNKTLVKRLPKFDKIKPYKKIYLYFKDGFNFNTAYEKCKS